MKKLISLICMIAIFFSMTANLTFADDDIKVYLNGEQIEFEDQQPVIIDGRTLVPLRGVFEAMGMSVEWKEYYVNINYEKKGGISCFIGKDNITTHLFNETGGRWVNEITSDVPPQIIGDRTMIPLRVVSETFGAEVEWTGTQKCVNISYNKSMADNFIEYLEQVAYEKDQASKQEQYERTKYYNHFADGEVPNFMHYIDAEPFLIDTDSNGNDYYLYDYSDYTGDINALIKKYISDIDKNTDFQLIDNEKNDKQDWYNLRREDIARNVRLWNKYSNKIIMIGLFRADPMGTEAISEALNSSTSRKTNTTNTSNNTTATNTKTESNKTNGDFTYLKDMSYTNLYKDATESYVQSYSQNSVRFELKRAKNKNVGLEKGDECKISVDYNLEGKYSKINGEMFGSGEAALRVYCDGVLKLTTPQIKSNTNLELDISGCKKLTLEVFGPVSGVGTRSFLQIREAELWY